jgi:hypothetical protein
MKLAGLNYVKLILEDRVLASLLFLFLLLAIGYCIFVGVSLRPSDLQVAVHYSAFGETGFYRDKWYYFINFIVFGVILAVSHLVITVKLFIQGRRVLAVSFAWLSIFLVVIAWLTTWAVLKVAFL